MDGLQRTSIQGATTRGLHSLYSRQKRERYAEGTHQNAGSQEMEYKKVVYISQTRRRSYSRLTINEYLK